MLCKLTCCGGNPNSRGSSVTSVLNLTCFPQEREDTAGRDSQDSRAQVQELSPDGTHRLLVPSSPFGALGPHTDWLKCAIKFQSAFQSHP